MPAGITKRCRLFWLTNNALSYMSPNAGGMGELRGLSQWWQLYTGAQINFGDLKAAGFQPRIVETLTHKVTYKNTVYVTSSELGLSQPLSRQQVCPSPQNRGGAHSPAGEGLGESQLRRLEKKLINTLPTLYSNLGPLLVAKVWYWFF